MKYRITHSTDYLYSQTVSQCHSEARLQPRSFSLQTCNRSDLRISPEALDYREHIDYFGNRVAYFTVQQSHAKLTVTAISEVDIVKPAHDLDRQATLSWEQALEELQNPEHLDVAIYRLDSEMTVMDAELHAYASQSFKPCRPLISVAQDINRRIYNEFSYDPGFTTITTPLSTVLTHKRGVCQDFAHLAIACFRSFGLPARYVSGYIETTPPPGVVKLTGTDASHAWFSIYLPGWGWLGFDPTNNCLTDEQHITLAWGRDYSDVTPLKGLAVGGGRHSVNVAVDVARCD